MATIHANGIDINYSLEGPADAPMVTLSNSLMSNHAMWDAQMVALTERYRVLRYDTRGHGGTEATPGPYTIALLVADLCALLDALDIAETHFVGLSMGGMIGQLLAIEHPARLRSLTLCDTSSHMGPASMWDERIRVAESEGMAGLVENTLARWFTPALHAADPDEIARIGAMIRGTSVVGFAGCCAAIRAMDHTAMLSRIATPTMIIVGAEDKGTTPEMSRIIQAEIPGAEMVVLPNAAHLSNIEQAAAFNEVLRGFLDRF